MSQQQHHLATQVLAALAARGKTLPWLADQLAEDVHYLRRKLHGQVPMRLEDWFLWTEFTDAHTAMFSNTAAPVR